MKPCRWLRFTLRTFFVLVTLIGCALGWLGWHAEIVRHRRAMRSQIEADGGVIIIGCVSNIGCMKVWQEVRPGKRYRVPLIRRLLGDQSIPLIGFERQLRDDDQEALDAIPEAAILATPKGG